MSQLTYLRTFLAVYRAGSVTKASIQLAITQPAASGHIKALEAHLKQTLFRRLGRGIEPTATADWLARAVAPYLDGLEETLGAATIRPNGLAGRLRLGGPAEFLGEKVLPGLGGLPELGLHLETQFGLAQDLVEHLEAGQLDLVIATARIPRKAIEVRLADKTGSLSRLAKRFGKGKVNLSSAYVLAPGRGNVTVAFGVKDARAAKKALGR